MARGRQGRVFSVAKTSTAAEERQDSFHGVLAHLRVTMAVLVRLSSDPLDSAALESVEALAERLRRDAARLPGLAGVERWHRANRAARARGGRVPAREMFPAVGRCEPHEVLVGARVRTQYGQPGVVCGFRARGTAMGVFLVRTRGGDSLTVVEANRLGKCRSGLRRQWALRALRRGLGPYLPAYLEHLRFKPGSLVPNPELDAARARFAELVGQ